MLVLARRGARAAGSGGRGRGTLRAAAGPAERRRAARGGVRAAVGPPARELPPGLHAPRARRGGDRARRGTSDPRGGVAGRSWPRALRPVARARWTHRVV